MRVRDGLTGMTARIKDNAVTGLRNALGERDLVRLGRHLGEQRAVGGRKACQVRIVILGNDQHVNGSLRIDVAKCKRAF